MEGFGSSDGVSYHYGSVEDGYVQNPTFEQRLKKKYWKTKQTVITKLKREEDEHVVAGDADIDIKLEKASHLQTSCQKLLHALAGCSYHTQALSSYEVSLSEFLLKNGDHDFTHAGEVMKQVGKAHDRNAKLRMRTIEPIFRLQQEFVTFSNTAIGDLSESIKRLEKARVDYRAALLWMKDVSARLHDPDARDQLAKFRESQAMVKESKIYFEKMKLGLMEKINMVAASRCNLLSHTLPQYQKEMLTYLDYSANELHKVLVSLRSQTQHQYKLKFLMDEEGEFETPAPEQDSEDKKEESEEGPPVRNDNSLFGLLQQELTPGKRGREGERGGGGGRANSSLPLTSRDEDLPSPFVRDLLFSTEEEEEENEAKKEEKGEVKEKEEGKLSTSQPRDLLTEEWDEFSTLDSKPLTETNNTNNNTDPNGDGDDWTDDLIEAEQPTVSRELMDEINELMATDDMKKETTNPNDIVFDPLLENNSRDNTTSPAIPSPSNQLFDNTLMPFNSAQLPKALPMGTSMLTPFINTSSTGSVSIPPVLPSPQATPNYLFNSGRGASGYKPMVGGGEATANPKDNPAQKWSNLFADLDPIANEKA